MKAPSLIALLLILLNVPMTVDATDISIICEDYDSETPLSAYEPHTLYVQADIPHAVVEGEWTLLLPLKGTGGMMESKGTGNAFDIPVIDDGYLYDINGDGEIAATVTFDGNADGKPVSASMTALLDFKPRISSVNILRKVRDDSYDTYSLIYDVEYLGASRVLSILEQEYGIAHSSSYTNEAPVAHITTPYIYSNFSAWIDLTVENKYGEATYTIELEPIDEVPCGISLSPADTTLDYPLSAHESYYLTMTDKDGKPLTVEQWSVTLPTLTGDKRTVATATNASQLYFPLLPSPGDYKADDSGRIPVEISCTFDRDGSRHTQVITAGIYARPYIRNVTILGKEVKEGASQYSLQYRVEYVGAKGLFIGVREDKIPTIASSHTSEYPVATITSRNISGVYGASIEINADNEYGRDTYTIQLPPLRQTEGSVKIVPDFDYTGIISAYEPHSFHMETEDGTVVDDIRWQLMLPVKDGGSIRASAANGSKSFVLRPLKDVSRYTVSSDKTIPAELHLTGTVNGERIDKALSVILDLKPRISNVTLLGKKLDADACTYELTYTASSLGIDRVLAHIEGETMGVMRADFVYSGSTAVVRNLDARSYSTLILKAENDYGSATRTIGLPPMLPRTGEVEIVSETPLAGGISAHELNHFHIRNNTGKTLAFPEWTLTLPLKDGSVNAIAHNEGSTAFDSPLVINPDLYKVNSEGEILAELHFEASTGELVAADLALVIDLKPRIKSVDILSQEKGADDSTYDLNYTINYTGSDGLIVRISQEVEDIEEKCHIVYDYPSATLLTRNILASYPATVEIAAENKYGTANHVLQLPPFNIPTVIEAIDADTKVTAVEVYTLSGRHAGTYPSLSGLPALPAGVYLLRIHTATGIRAAKHIVH